MIAVAVAIGLVSDARSKTVSSVMSVGIGRSLRRPNALQYTTLPRCNTSTTAPGS